MRNRFPKIKKVDFLLLSQCVFNCPWDTFIKSYAICATSCAIRKIGYSSRFARFFSQGRYTADEGAPPP